MLIGAPPYKQLAPVGIPLQTLRPLVETAVVAVAAVGVSTALGVGKPMLSGV